MKTNCNYRVPQNKRFAIKSTRKITHIHTYTHIQVPIAQAITSCFVFIYMSKSLVNIANDIMV